MLDPSVYEEAPLSALANAHDRDPISSSPHPEAMACRVAAI